MESSIIVVFTKKIEYNYINDNLLTIFFIDCNLNLVYNKNFIYWELVVSKYYHILLKAYSNK